MLLCDLTTPAPPGDEGGGMGGRPMAMGHEGRWTIDGRPFDPARDDQSVAFGTVGLPLPHGRPRRRRHEGHGQRALTRRQI
jgi:hypothetical protein